MKHKQVTSFIFQGNELNKAKVSMLNSSFLLKKININEKYSFNFSNKVFSHIFYLGVNTP